MSETAPTADALSRLGRSRDAAAWTWLVERHGDAVARLARRVIDDPQLAEDACQEAFLAIRDAATSFRAPAAGAEAAAVGWLMRVACNAALKAARSRQRRRRRETSLPQEQPMPAPEPPADPELARAIAVELARLPERHRLPLHLHFHAGLAYPELAAAMSVSVNAARVRVHRALAALRQRLGTSAPSLSVAVLAERLGDAGPAAAAHRSDLIRLLDSPRRAATGGLSAMATISIGAGIAACAALAFAVLGARGAEAPSAPAAPAFTLAQERFVDLAISAEFADAPIDEVQDFFTRVLRVPLSVDAPPGGIPTLSLTVKHMRLGNCLHWIAELEGLGVDGRPDGGFLLRQARPGEQQRSTPMPFEIIYPEHLRPFTMTAVGATSAQLLAAFSAAGGCELRVHAPETGGIARSSMRLHIRDEDGAMRKDPLLAAMMPVSPYGALPHEALLRRVVKARFTDAPISAVLAGLAQQSGLPCRVDDRSGPFPRLTMDVMRIELRSLLQEIAQRCHASLTMSGDGMVIYRPAAWRRSGVDDHDGEQVGGAGPPDDWWAFRRHYADQTMRIEPGPGTRLVSVAWDEAPLSRAARELAAAAGIAVHVDPDVSDERVLLELHDRELRDVLECLRYAASVDCVLGEDGLTISRLKGSADQPTPAPAPEPAPQPILRDHAGG